MGLSCARAVIAAITLLTYSTKKKRPCLGLGGNVCSCKFPILSLLYSLFVPKTFPLLVSPSATTNDTRSSPSPSPSLQPRRQQQQQQQTDERCHQFLDSLSVLESSCPNSPSTRNTAVLAVYFGPRTSHGSPRSSNACPSSPIFPSSSSSYSVLPAPHISSPPFFF